MMVEISPVVPTFSRLLDVFDIPWNVKPISQINVFLQGALERKRQISLEVNCNSLADLYGNKT
jgi:hypothetical protein